MQLNWVLWLASGSLASLMLLSMMRRRQLALVGLLKDYVERQAQWARRRAKADRLAAENSESSPG
jgi:hypothetical protein